MVQGQLVSLKRGEAYSCEEEFIDVTVTITPLQKQTNKKTHNNPKQTGWEAIGLPKD